MFEQIGFQGLLSGVLHPQVPADLYVDYDDFTKQPVDDEDYAFTQATTGTWVLDASTSSENGRLLLDSNSTTEGQGANMQRPSASFLPEANRTIWFECRIKTDLAAKIQLFAGLSAISTAIISANAMDTTNSHCGFTCAAGSATGAVLSSVQKASSTYLSTSTGFTLVNDTWVVLGIKIDGVTSATFFVDGSPVACIAENIPTVALSPSFVCQSYGTDDPILYIDYWVCQQTR